jgi:hypothetical protein
MIAPPLADFLRARRADCNARFAAARRLRPRLDAGDFSLFLRDQVSPLASAVDAGESYIVLDQAYDLGLRLVAEKLAGPAAFSPAINSLWATAFPAMATLIATAPRRVIGSLSNAAHHLSATPDARPEIWQRRLIELAPLCSNVDELLTVAQTLAWRAGFAHYRVPALTAVDSLPPALALAALEAPSDSNWDEVRDAHLSDPWFGYSHGRRVGAFRGFGGLFLTPPLVTLSESHLLVRSGDEAWILVADAFGATFHRASSDEIQGASPILPPKSGFPFLPPGQKPTSGVILGTTYAVTTAQSHSIWLGPISSQR